MILTKNEKLRLKKKKQKNDWVIMNIYQHKVISWLPSLVSQLF